ncbi:MAG: amidohydrolase family protein [Wenzhouxiangella sp.]|nr:amidohydrolase family protein [Wenzhouxiangella sp.]
MRFLIAALSLSLLLTAEARTLLFENVQLVDVTSASVSTPGSLAVRDGFIVDADSVSDPDIVISQAGYLIPGLAEMHAHVPQMRLGEQLVQDTLMLYLAHGITTIRGMLGEPGHLALRQQLAAGEVIGPRFITSGPSFNANSVSSPSAARAMVRAQAEAGYDLLKLHPGLWPEAFHAIAETAEALGIDYSGHISVAVGLDRTLASRQGSIDHLDGYGQKLVPEDHALHGTDPGLFAVNLVAGMDPDLIPELARRTAESGVANVPTQSLLENWATGDVDALFARDGMRWIPAQTRAQWRTAIENIRSRIPEGQGERFIEIRRALIAALHEAGAPILLGADAPQILSIPGAAIPHARVIYVEVGMSPAAALATGTINVARYLNQPAHGCLQAACVADLVLLANNPLEDIRHTRSILGVMRAGQWFDRDRLDSELAAIAERAGP